MTQSRDQATQALDTLRRATARDQRVIGTGLALRDESFVLRVLVTESTEDLPTEVRGIPVIQTVGDMPHLEAET